MSKTGPAAPTSYEDDTRLASLQTDQDRNVLFWLSKRRKRALIACSCLLQFLLQFDVAAVAVTIPEIAKDQKAPQVKAFALVTGYCLAQTVFQLVFSHVSHALGRKVMYLVGLAFFIVGAGAASSGVPIDALIGLRVVQGIGAAGMFTMSAIVIVDMTQPRERAGWTSISQAFGALGNICGPVYAGQMFKHHQQPWNSIFWFEVPAAVVLFMAVLFLLPREYRDRNDRLLELKRCDWAGMALFFMSAVAILVPINVGGTTPSMTWGSGAVAAIFGVGIAILISFICHQRFVAKRPAFPRELFARCATTGAVFPFNCFARFARGIAFLGNVVCGILLFMVFYSLVIFWEGVRQRSTVQVAIAMLSVTLTYPVAFALTGIAIRRWGRIRYAIAAGALLSTLGLGLMQLMTEDTPQGAAIFIDVIAAAGCGVFTPAMINAVIATTESRWHPHAIAARTLFYTAGQCIGVSLGMYIFTVAFKARFEAQDGDAALKAQVGQMTLGDPQELLSKINELRKLAPNGELVSMVVGALRWVWGVALVFASVTGALAILMNCPDLPEDSTTQTAPSDEEQGQNGIQMASR